MSDHARLGASASFAWLDCTKYPEMNEGRDRQPSQFAAEGTVAHAFSEGYLLAHGVPKVGDAVCQQAALALGSWYMHGHTYRDGWKVAAVVFLALTVASILPQSDCHTDWDGRSNPTVCD